MGLFKRSTDTIESAAPDTADLARYLALIQSLVTQLDEAERAADSAQRFVSGIGSQLHELAARMELLIEAHEGLRDTQEQAANVVQRLQELTGRIETERGNPNLVDATALWDEMKRLVGEELPAAVRYAWKLEKENSTLMARCRLAEREVSELAGVVLAELDEHHPTTDED